VLGLVYLISKLLTYSTSSRQAPPRRSRTQFFASGASHSDAVTRLCLIGRLPPTFDFGVTRRRGKQQPHAS